jgi:hypothetical protein
MRVRRSRTDRRNASGSVLVGHLLMRWRSVTRSSPFVCRYRGLVRCCRIRSYRRLRCVTRPETAVATESGITPADARTVSAPASAGKTVAATSAAVPTAHATTAASAGVPTAASAASTTSTPSAASSSTASAGGGSCGGAGD